MIELHNIDCMEYLATLQENAFELAIVDPPYGIKMHGGKSYGCPSRPTLYKKLKPPKHESKSWDNNRPDLAYFTELERVTKNRVIWGGNYFSDFLPPSMGWVYWGKFENGSDFSDGELAYTSFDRALRSFRVHPFSGTNGGKNRIHPTQKPVKLYEWLLHNYAKEGDRILDTHLGSGSSAIACHNGGFDFVGCELDTDYFNAAKKRLQQHQSQIRIF